MPCGHPIEVVSLLRQFMPRKHIVALKNVIGIDHAVVMVRDLDKAAENWKRLGFTVSPRGTHSAHMGSGNYTIMLEQRDEVMLRFHLVAS